MIAMSIINPASCLQSLGFCSERSKEKEFKRVNHPSHFVVKLIDKWGWVKSKSIDMNFRNRIPIEACFLAAAMGAFGDLLIVPFMNKQLSGEATVVRLVNIRVKAESHPASLIRCSFAFHSAQEAAVTVLS